MTTVEAVLIDLSVRLADSRLRAERLSLLTGFRVDHALRLPARAELRFAGTFPEVDGLLGSSGGLGDAVEITVGDGTLFSGQLTGVEVRHGHHGAELVLTALDGAHALARSSTVTARLEMSISRVVEEVAKKAGLKAKTTATGALPYHLQAENDLAYLDALADRTGHDWWVDEKGRLHFTRPTSVGERKVTLYEELEELSVRATGVRADTVEVRGWDRDTQKALIAKQPAAGTHPEVSGTLSEYGKPKSLDKERVLHLTGLNPASAAEAKTLAESAADRLVSSAVTARGTLRGTAAVKVCTDLTVAGAGRANGTYPVTRVEHVYDRRRFETRWTSGERRPTGLVDELGGRGRPSTSLVHSGLVVGVVSNINDPDKAGKVKVDLHALGDKIESHWARVLSLGGGQGRGLVVLPEVDDEVVLGFENGDASRPVVLGGVFSAKVKTPAYEIKGGKLAARRLTSRSGHVLELSDGGGSTDEHVLIALAKGKGSFRIGTDKCDLEVPANVPIKVKAGTSTVTLDGKGKIELKGIDIVIKGDKSVAIDAPQINVKAGMALKLEGGATADVKAASTTVQATAVLQLKGNAMVKIN